MMVSNTARSHGKVQHLALHYDNGREERGILVTATEQDLAWRVGGPQGSGIDTAAGIFARACAAGGLEIFGRREYYSNIMGRHSYYDVRVSDRRLTSHRDVIDMLSTFEGETLLRHALAVAPGGAIIYSETAENVSIDDPPFLDVPVKENLRAYLGERDLPQTAGGLLEDARRRGVHTFAIPYQQVGARLKEELGVSQAVADRLRNTIAAAVCFALLDYDADYLRIALEKTFHGKNQIVDLNFKAVELAYRFVKETFPNHGFQQRLRPKEAEGRRILVSGSQAVAMGKLAGGMTMQTYYPISPATDESVFLEGNGTYPTRNGEKGSVLVVQTEDEISAVTMAAGAALTGARTATATSGPGFSLMVEGMGWAGSTEIPLVITLYQRGGPSTGLPTRNEQGDLRFAIHAGHGEFPRVVLASGDLTEAFYDAATAFNYAERYQTVVIHLMDKNLGSTTQTLPPFDLEQIHIDRGERYHADNGNDQDPAVLLGRAKRFQITESGISPRPYFGQPGGMYWMAGGEHTEEGRVSEDPSIREQQMEKRDRKRRQMELEIPDDDMFRLHGDENAALTIASWGSTKGAILEALQRLDAEGIRARFLQLRILEPFPSSRIEGWIRSANPLVVVEGNFSGQFAQLLREKVGRGPDHLVLKYNGRPISGNELVHALKRIVTGDAEERMVLRNPYE